MAPVTVISDDAKLAAQISCIFAHQGIYLPILDGPRLQRQDASAEIVRRNNAAARAGAKVIVLAGLPQQSIEAFQKKYPQYPCEVISNIADLNALSSSSERVTNPLRWGSDRIGVGQLIAMRSGCSIVFDDAQSPAYNVPSESGHLVVCEQGEELTEVIAANYAYSLGAGLQLIPKVSKTISREILEGFYNLIDSDSSPTDLLIDLKEKMRGLCGPLSLDGCSSVSFISAEIPFGFAFPEVPSTHLFTYPDIGISIVNGFAAEQPQTRGVNVAILVDPEQTEAPEINDAAAALADRDTLVRVYRGANANVTSVTEAMEHFPYDLLLFATHCGDASGYLWTYHFEDIEGCDRTLVVEVTPGIGRSEDPDVFKVTEYIRFKSLDGVDLDDDEKKSNLYIGTAIRDWSNLYQSKAIKPAKRETVARVQGSAVLRMHDNNMVLLQQYLACNGTPIVITNACSSWHQLALRLTFQNARAYIGTLFPVLAYEAHPVVISFLDRHYGKPLAEALWLAQNEAYDIGVRRPYVLSGVYPQKLRTSPEDKLERIHRLLLDGRNEWSELLHRYQSTNDQYGAREAQDIVRYYTREADAAGAFRERLKQSPK